MSRSYDSCRRSTGRSTWNVCGPHRRARQERIQTEGALARGFLLGWESDGGGPEDPGDRDALHARMAELAERVA